MSHRSSKQFKINPSVTIESLHLSGEEVEIAIKLRTDLSYLYKRNHCLNTYLSNLLQLLTSLEYEGNLTRTQKDVFEPTQKDFNKFSSDIKALVTLYSKANRIINPQDPAEALRCEPLDQG